MHPIGPFAGAGGRSRCGYGRLGIAPPLIATGAFLVLGIGNAAGVAVGIFWGLEGLAVLLSLAVLFWRGPAMPRWARVLAVLTLVAEAAFVWVLYQGLSRLS